MNIGASIQEARKKCGLTQEQLAQKIGVATITIRQYELGKRQPRLEQIQELSNALKVPMSDLMGVKEYVKECFTPEYMDLQRKHDTGTATARQLEQYDKMRRERGIDPSIDDKLNPAPPTDTDYLRSNAVNQLDHLNDEGLRLAADYIDVLHSIPKYNDNVKPSNTKAGE